MNAIWMAVLFISAAVRVQSEVKYCDAGYRCPDKEHLMCNPLFQEKQSDDTCLNIKFHTLSEEDRKWILGAHNCMRDRVASSTVPDAAPDWPQASNMQKMTWDDEMAMFSKRWAFQCRRGSYSCTTTDAFASFVSMSTWFMTRPGPAPSYKEGLESWFQQMNKAKKTHVVEFPEGEKPSDGFWHMVWGDANKIGCAYVTFDYHGDDRKCEKKEEGSSKCEIYARYEGTKFVCHYGPTGVPPGELAKAWTVGEPCSECTKSSNQYADDRTPEFYARATCGGNSSIFMNLCTDPLAPAIDEQCILVPLNAPLKSQNFIVILLATGSAAYASH